MESIPFSEKDLAQLEEHGISIEEAQQQVNAIREGFPYPDVISSASLEQGIIRIEPSEQNAYLDIWEQHLANCSKIIYKMVPASGAASRMFKDLIAFAKAEYDEPQTEAEKTFFEHIDDFAFADRLNEACLRNEWKSLSKLIAAGQYKTITENLIEPKGMNYGNLPKGLLLFHAYPESKRTAAEEHLSEGALYIGQANGSVNIHFTVSPEHEQAFRALIEQRVPLFRDYYGLNFNVTYSVQKPATDTLALTEEDELFRKEDGSLLFRPGGHGALISNLGELPDADVVFIKNIDNVEPDYYKAHTIIYKKLLGGVLVEARRESFRYLRQLESDHVSHSDLEKMADFLANVFEIRHPEQKSLSDAELKAFVKAYLNRPMRVCGMVRNEGEPGGGPFIVREADGTTSLQILESSQFDLSRKEQKELFENGHFFNPVDLVCSIVNYKGESFDLKQFINPKTAFIAHKSSGGRNLKAMERPGLWNGAMHYWNTIFVEVPIQTFNPVKTVNDLLRPQHQPGLKK